MTPRVPTSVVLDALLEDAPADHVTLAWLLERLSERSFGIVMLVMGLVALVPGASLFVGVLLAIPAIQMMLARRAPAFPGFIARRRLSTPRLARAIARINPVLRRLERIVRPRWPTPFETTKRAIGFVVLLLGATLLMPIPFSHIIPSLAIMLLSLAFLEEDGVVLCIALIAASISLAIAGTAVWATVRGIDFLDRL